jgi:hypothetical protein
VIDAIPAFAPPVTTPEASTDAIVGEPLLHVPPADASLNVIFENWHTGTEPVIAAGVGLTTTFCVLTQPVGSV